MLPLLMLGLFTASSHQTDRRYSRLVSHIHAEVHALCKDGDESALLPNPKWMRQFRLSIPRTETGYLRRIQKSIDPRCEAACEIAFVLAYYHVDFAANFGRMLRSDYNDQYVPVSIVEGDITEDFADYLYRQYPSRTALRIWLNTLVDADSAEAAAPLWYDVWKRNRAGMLLAAAGSKTRIRHVADALSSAYEDPEPEDEKTGVDIVQRRIFRDLNRLRRSANPVIARTARAVLLEIRSSG